MGLLASRLFNWANSHISLSLARCSTIYHLLIYIRRTQHISHYHLLIYMFFLKMLDSNMTLLDLCDIHVGNNLFPYLRDCSIIEIPTINECQENWTELKTIELDIFNPDRLILISNANIFYFILIRSGWISHFILHVIKICLITNTETTLYRLD